MLRAFVLAIVAAAGIGTALLGTVAPAAAGQWGHGYGSGGPRYHGPPPRHNGWGGPGRRHRHYGPPPWARPVPPWHRYGPRW
jgi:hypothetical protein